MAVMVGAEVRAGNLGRIVTSRLGRDRGAVYLVIAETGPSLVLVADGRGRPMTRPKRKNIKHLEFGAVAPGVVPKLTAGQPLTDEEIRAAIAAAAVPG